MKQEKDLKKKGGRSEFCPRMENEKKRVSPSGQARSEVLNPAGR
jgi:hypothetical protein